MGSHAGLLADISSSIAAFQGDVESLGIANRIMTVSFSEFGGQVKENASLGTDHGDLAPFFVIGNSITAGILGDHPVFSNTTGYYYNQIQRRYDYRQLFASLLQDWLGADGGLIAASELSSFVQPGQKVDIVAPTKKADVVCTVLSTSEVLNGQGVKVYPNPANQFVKVLMNKPVREASAQIFDMSGRTVRTIQLIGTPDQFEIDTASLQAGSYILKINSGAETFTTKLLIQH